MRPINYEKPSFSPKEGGRGYEVGKKEGEKRVLVYTAVYYTNGEKIILCQGKGGCLIGFSRTTWPLSDRRKGTVRL